MKTICASCNTTVEDAEHPAASTHANGIDLTFRRKVAELMERDASIAAHVMCLNHKLKMKLNSLRVSLICVSPNFVLKNSEIYGKMQLELTEIAQINGQILDLHLKD